MDTVISTLVAYTLESAARLLKREPTTDNARFVAAGLASLARDLRDYAEATSRV